MSLEEVFLRDVLTNPADDTPRRIYADWLLDQVDPHQAARGELIHVQCERAARPPDDPELIGLLAAERELLAAHQRAWGGPLAGLVERWEYRRGFPEAVTLSARAFLDHAPAFFAQGPIREVRLREATWLLTDLAASPSLAPLTVLDLRENEIEEWGLRELARAPHAGVLRVLDLSRNRLGASGVEALLRRAMLPALKVLRLNGSRLGGAGAQTLVTARFYRPDTGEASLVDRLTTIEIADCDLGPTGAEALGGNCPAGLTELDLGRNRLGAGGVWALLTREGWRRLGQVQRLDLSGNDMGPAGAEAVVQSGEADGLTFLGLSHNGLGDEGVEELGGRPYGTRRWAEVALAGNGIGPAGARALVGMPWAGQLRRLDLERNELGADGAEVLASSRNLAGLTDLNLAHNRLGPAGVENLLASPNLTKLKRLVLRGNGISGRGVRALLAAPQLDALLDLDVTGNKLDGEDGRRLRARFGARVRV